MPTVTMLTVAALLRLQEARARNNVADLARKKLWNLDGRIEAGTALYVALQGWGGGQRNASQCRAIVRRARQRAEGAITHARQQLTEVQTAQEGRDKCLASLQQATGSLDVVRVVTERLVQELATELEVRRTQLVGQLIGLRGGRRRHQLLARQVADMLTVTVLTTAMRTMAMLTVAMLCSAGGRARLCCLPW